jgi:hypothetical protein
MIRLRRELALADLAHRIASEHHLTHFAPSHIVATLRGTAASPISELVRMNRARL